MLKSNFKEFEKELAQEIKKQQNEQINTFKEIVITCFGNVIRLSPVQTGYFRANNLISLGSPTNNTLDFTKGKTYSSDEESKKQQIRQAQVKNNTSIFIQNNLKYADKLENGASQQAPAGVYSVALAQTRQAVKKAQREIIE